MRNPALPLTAAACAAAVFLTVLGHAAVHGSPPVTSEEVEIVLVGTGCGDGRETMVAREEDDFPTDCASIDAHWIEVAHAR